MQIYRKERGKICWGKIGKHTAVRNSPINTLDFEDHTIFFTITQLGCYREKIAIAIG